MKMKLMALAVILAMVLGGYGVFPAQASTKPHQFHDYGLRVYVKTTQGGTYTHKYITGVNPVTCAITYGLCEVTYETEYYTKKCYVEGCYATDRKLFPVEVETHNQCPQ